MLIQLVSVLALLILPSSLLIYNLKFHESKHYSIFSLTRIVLRKGQIRIHPQRKINYEVQRLVAST